MSNYGNATKKTRFGTVTIRNPGPKTTPANVKTLVRAKDARRRVDGEAVGELRYTKSAGIVTLQGPALRAFMEAEELATPARLRRKGKVIPIILTGIGGRTYATQAALYYGPDNTNGTRFADPDGSNHVEFLAVDVHTGFLALLQGVRAKAALKKVGFYFTVSGEAWHGSFAFPG